MASLERHITTDHLPAPEMMPPLVQETHRRSKSNNDGNNSQACPALARSALRAILCVAVAAGFGASSLPLKSGSSRGQTSSRWPGRQ
jgi:hypothetical protein